MKIPCHRPTRLLIISDATPLRWRLRELIEETCCVDIVGEAPSARSALALIQSQPPDAIVLDLELQSGTTAFSLLDAIRKIYDGVIVALTSNAIPPYEARCSELGVNHFFDKFRQMERVPEVLRLLQENRRPSS